MAENRKEAKRFAMSAKHAAFRLGFVGLMLAFTVAAAAEQNRGGEKMKIGHIHVGIRDLKSALSWFDKVLEWKPTYQDERIAILHPGPISLILDASDADVPATIAVPSEDVDADHARLTQRGAVSLGQPSDMPYGVRASYLKGPGGLKIEIEGPLKNSGKERSKPGGYSLSIEIEAPVAEVWKAWTGREVLERWLAPKANVAFREGGAWEFFWSDDPAKDSTLGCKILKIEPERFLRFEWQGKTEFLDMFLPPRGRRTAIEVRFEKTATGTRVNLTQAETRDDAKWPAYEAWMSKAWEMALQGLKKRSEEAQMAVGR